MFSIQKPYIYAAIDILFGPLEHCYYSIFQEILQLSWPTTCLLCCSWSELPVLQSARVCLGVEWLSDGHVFAVGGKDSTNQPTATVEMLECSWDTEEPANGGWRYVAPMNHARWLHAVAFIKGKIIAAGGDERDSIECFTLPTVDFPQGQWVLIRPMMQPGRLAGVHPFGDDLLFVGKRWLRAWMVFNG